MTITLTRIPNIEIQAIMIESIRAVNPGINVENATIIRANVKRNAIGAVAIHARVKSVV